MTRDARPRGDQALVAAGAVRSATPRPFSAQLPTFDCIDVIHVTDAVRARTARPFPHEPIRTLDAIPLATAEALGEPPQLVTIVTREARVQRDAEALGYVVE